jgi:hypothetical protein
MNMHKLVSTFALAAVLSGPLLAQDRDGGRHTAAPEDRVPMVEAQTGAAAEPPVRLDQREAQRQVTRDWSARDNRRDDRRDDRDDRRDDRRERNDDRRDWEKDRRDWDRDRHHWARERNGWDDRRWGRYEDRGWRWSRYTPGWNSYWTPWGFGYGDRLTLSWGLRYYDGDRDGRLRDWEWRRAQRDFYRFADRNGDGYVTRREYDRAVDAIRWGGYRW